MRLEKQDRTLANIAFVIAVDVLLSWFHYCFTMFRKFGLFSSFCGKGVVQVGGWGWGEREVFYNRIVEETCPV
jgi:hypothetical protein